MAGNSTSLAFRDFCLNLSSFELRKNGLRVRLRRQATRVLAALARRSGEVVTREELQRELWKDDTFVDFESGLNNCIKQIREALNDDAESPNYIETIPKLGYRFLTPVRVLGEANRSDARLAAIPEAASKAWNSRWFWAVTAASLLGVAAIAAWLLIGRPAFSFHERDSVLITDFENQTGDPRFDDALRTAFTVSLEQSRYANVVPRGRIDAALKRMGKSEKERVTPELGREICQRESVRGMIAAGITRTGNEYALTAELIDPASGVPVRSYSERVHGEDRILDALDTIAGKIRTDLGESLYEIHQANRPLPQVTTASLAALKAYADGISLWRERKFDDAEAQYNAAVSLDPNFAMAHAALGFAYCSYIFSYQREKGSQEYQRALALSSRVTERERRIIEVDYADSVGHFDDADRLYRLFVADYPDDWVMRGNYARILRMHGRQADALEQYQELLRIAPNDASTYVEMATAYKSMGRPADAIRAYSEAFRLAPSLLNLSTLNREYGFTLVANGEEGKAEQVFSASASNADTRASGLHSLGLLDLMCGRYAKAQTRFEEALSLAEQRHEPLSIARNHFLLAVVADGEGNRAKQMKQLEAALADFQNLGPKVEYGSLVGQEYARAGAVANAEKIEKVIAPLADPGSEEQSGYVRLLQGEIALAKGDALDATRLFALEDLRFGEPFRLSKEAAARAYDKAGDTDRAISSYEQLLAGGWCHLTGWEPQQRCEEARIALARDYLARGDRQKAQAALAPMLKDWLDADASLPLKKQALQLQSQISNQ